MKRFDLTDEDEIKLEKWKNKIKKKHGKYGLFTYKFTPTGIGTVIEVESDLTGKTLNLTDVDTW